MDDLAYQEVQNEHWHSDAMNRRKAVEDPMIAYIFGNKARRLKANLPAGEAVNRIFDGGCGNGYFQHYLNNVFEVPCYGMDFSASILGAGAAAGRSFQGTLSSVPFEDNSFDLVCESGVFHHLTAPVEDEAIKELIRVSRKWIFFSEPNCFNPVMFAFGVLSKKERRSLIFNPSRLRGYAKKFGMELVANWTSDIVTPNITPRPVFEMIRNREYSVGLMCNALYRKL